MPFSASWNIDSLMLIIFLAAVQGVTEFLPISSSGHLLILSEIWGRPLESLELSIALHLGSLLAIGIYYRQQIFQMLTSDRHVVLLLFVATVPAVVGGVVAYLWGDPLLEDARTAAALLPITALVLLLCRRLAVGQRSYADLSWTGALRIGLWQMIAILPGLSRSGLTIFGGLREKLAPPAAAAFSFLMAIPAIAGASVLAAWSAWKRGTTDYPISELSCGILISCITGLGALVLLERHVKRLRLDVYIGWCLSVSLAYWVWKYLY